ncbi:hypothetical protein PInf_013234 [Phytophthora infestans]|nr:hypothetical protein PInf_013234 [Phytophthora infestans]
MDKTPQLVKRLVQNRIAGFTTLVISEAPHETVEKHNQERVRSQSEESASPGHQETVKRRKMLPFTCHQEATKVGSKERRQPPLLEDRRSEGEQDLDAGHLPKRSCIHECTALLSSMDNVGSAIAPADTTVADSPVEKRWLGCDEFEAQLDAIKEDELGGDDE